MVTGRLVVGGSVLGTHPLASVTFDVSPTRGGVYRVRTDARGYFRFRGQPGVYYPVLPAHAGPPTDLRTFRVVAGRTTRVILNEDAAVW